MALSGTDVSLELTGTATSMTNEAMSDTGNGTLWTIDAAAKDIFDPATTFTVEVDSGGGFSTVAASDYTIRYLVGAVDFDSTQSGNSVRISGKYLPKFSIAEAYSHTLSIEPNLADVTRYGDSAPRRLRTVEDVSGDFSLYEINETNLDDPTNNEPTLEDLTLRSGSTDPDIVMSVDPDGNGNHLYRAWITFDEEALNIPVDGAIDKQISFQGSKQDATMSTQTASIVDAIG